MNRASIPLLLAAAWFAACDTERVAGGSTSETSNGIAVRVFAPDGKPAARVLLRIRPEEYLATEAPASQDPSLGILDLRTDDSGRALLPARLVHGRIEAIGATSAAQGSLDTAKTRLDLHLAAPSTLGGKVKLRPTDFPAKIQARGLEHETWSDHEGNFVLDDLPAGPVRIRAWIPRRNASASTRASLPPGSQVGSALLEPKEESPSGWTDSLDFFLDTRDGLIDSEVDLAPLQLQLDGDDFPDSAKPDGSDLRLVDRTGKPVPFVVSRWSPASKQGRIWFLAGSIQPSDTTRSFRLRWGRSDADPASDPWTVFDAAHGWGGVWNLSRTYLDDQGRHRVVDATGWSNDGVLTGSPTADPVQGMRFTRSGRDGLSMSGSRTNLSSDFTVLLLAKPEARGAVLLGRGDSSWDHGKKWFTLQERGSSRRLPGWHPTFMGWTDTSYNVYSVSETRIDSGAWTFLAARRSTEGDGAVEWFVDGSKTATKIAGGTDFEVDRARDSLFVGFRHGSTSRFVGSMAEIWILNRPMSDDWIRLQAACRTPGGPLVKIRR